MGIPAMRREDTDAYIKYAKKVVVLSNTVKVIDGCLGEYVYVEIIDGNRKHFRRHKLSKEFLPMMNTDELDNNVKILVYEYISNRIYKKAIKEINEKLVKDWQQEKLIKDLMDWRDNIAK